MSPTETSSEVRTKKPDGTQEISEEERQRRRNAKKAREAREAKAAAEEPAEKPSNGNGVATEELKQAVAEAVKDAFAVTDSWQPRKVVKFKVDLPSGQPVLLKHLDTKDLLRANLLEEMDRFTKMLFPSALDAQGAPVEEDDAAEAGIWTVLRDPEKRCRFFDMTNRLLVVACVKPKLVNDGVALRENDEGEKEEVFGYEVESIDEQVKLFGKPVPTLKENEAYVGVVEFADRMAIFQELNKPLEMVEPFREKSDAVLASLQPSQGVSDTSERPV